MTRMGTDRIGWADLPEAVRALVQERTGRVSGSCPAGGDRSDIAATLDTETGPVFIKGGGDGIFARSLQNEAHVTPHVTGIAPALLWRIDAEGWTVLGLEHVAGRHADYSPGSPDLNLLRDALERLQRVPLPVEITRGQSGTTTAWQPSSVTGFCTPTSTPTTC